MGPLEVAIILVPLLAAALVAWVVVKLTRRKP